jgi:diguanylate cyclase (GGDEF)-like protein
LLTLADQPATAATAALERCRAAVQRLGIEHVGAPAGVLTISAGVAAFVPDRPVSTEEVLKLADVALYRAKAAGRNAVTVAEGP